MTMQVRGEKCDQPDGDLDEVVAKNAMVLHLERMSNNEWVLLIQEPYEQVIVSIHTRHARIGAFIYEAVITHKGDTTMEGTPLDFHIYVRDGSVTTVLDENDPQRTELMKAWAEIFNKNDRYREADECLGIGVNG